MSVSYRISRPIILSRRIRYAMAATGARRWADPEDAHSAIEGGVPMAGCFSGTFDASRYGPVCPQVRCLPAARA